MIEITLRAVDYEGLSLMKKHPILGQVYKPHLQTTVYSEEAREFVPIRINSLGFRDREHVPGAVSGKRVVILGDSFVAAFSVNFKETFPQLCEEYLNRQSPEDWEVINLGVAGFGTAQEMLSYQEYGRKYRPDVVVLAFFPGNDVSDNSSELSSNPRVYYTVDAGGKLIRERAGELRSNLSSLLNEYSRFYVWQKTQMKKLEHYYRYRIVLNPSYRVFLSQDDPKTLRAWEITRALLKQLADDVKRDHAQLLVLYIPFPDAIYPDWWRETLQSSPPMQEEKWDPGKPEQIIAAFCKENNISFLSPGKTFAEDTSRRYYFRHGHLNESGHRTTAELLGEWILRVSSESR